MKIIIWLSWWPDSMFLTFLLSKKFWKDKLILAHYNHNFRKDSEKEEKYLRDIFKNYDFVSNKYSWKDFKESTLRKARYDFFKKIGWWKYWLALGHNLTDRIETSFLNLLRWWWLDWFLNMRKIDYSRKIIRPLINIPKFDILKKCESLDIPYFVDYTNFDIKFSKRNLIRNKIISFLENIDYKFYYSFQNLYTQLESLYPTFNLFEYLTEQDNNIFLLTMPTYHKKFFVKQLLDYFWVKDLRHWVIDEILNYINYAKGWGFKRYWKIFFYKKNWKIYLKIDKNFKTD